MQVIGPIAIGNVLQDAEALKEIIDTHSTWDVARCDEIGPHDFMIDSQRKILLYGPEVHAHLKRAAAFLNN